MISALLKQAAVSIVALGVFWVFKFVYCEWTSPLWYIRGPPTRNLLYGNFMELWAAKDQLNTYRSWIAKYGPTFKYRGLLFRSRVYTLDLKAINHVLMNTSIYQKQKEIVYNIKLVLGEGLLVVEGDVHKKQRRILNPAFGLIQIRELTPIFVENATRLRDIWASKIKAGGGEAQVEALSWLGKTALEIIGEAGFGYKLGALSEDPNVEDELSQAFATMFDTGRRAGLIWLLRGAIPLLRCLKIHKDVENSRATKIMFRIGKELMDKRKRGIASSEKSTGKDLLTLLIRANTSTDIPEHQRMTDEEVLAQIPTFIVAGHETTGTTTAWALYAISRDKSMQEKLRAELQTIGTDNPTMDELNSLSYLDAIIRETLRLYPAIPNISRVAMEDDILPLGNPVEDALGRKHHALRIPKGQGVAVPITLVNMSKEIWGEDASEFNPSRWDAVPEAASNIPGLWGNILSFLGGPRGCIGYRFSLIEIKAVLFTLIRSFHFELAVPPDDIVAKADIGLMARPMLRTDPARVNQLPVIIRPVV